MTRKNSNKCNKYSDNDYNKKPKRKHSRKSSTSSSSSSCSSLSTDEKIINDKVNYTHNKLNRLVQKVKYLEKQLRKSYCRHLRMLRREKCLMVNGCDAYATYLSYVPQTVEVNAPFVFDISEKTLNVELINNRSIKILRSGMYKVNFSVQLDQPGQVALFVNDVIVETTTTANNSAGTTLTDDQILAFNAGDLLQWRNYISNGSIVTAKAGAGLAQPTQNLDFNLFRIAPLPEGCCIPPPINCEPNCCYDTDSCSSDSHSHSDSDKPKPPRPPKQVNQEQKQIKEQPKEQPKEQRQDKERKNKK